MIRIRFSLVFIFLWIGLTACEHKDLCYDHPHFATVRVIFDWTKISNHDKPEGMRVVFYPTDDESNTWIFDFPGGEDGEVELPENDYRVICFNYDTDGMVWKENGSYTLFTADTRDVRSPDNRTMAVTPTLAVWRPYRRSYPQGHSGRKHEDNTANSRKHGMSLHV